MHTLLSAKVLLIKPKLILGILWGLWRRLDFFIGHIFALLGLGFIFFLHERAFESDLNRALALPALCKLLMEGIHVRSGLENYIAVLLGLNPVF